MDCWIVAAVLPFAVALLLLLVKAISTYVLRPLHIQKLFNAQGIYGPPFRIPFGNFREFVALNKAARASPMPHISHDLVPRLLPHYAAWSAQYGNPFVYWLGPKPRLMVVDVELCKEMLSNKLGHYPKQVPVIQLQDLLAKGLVTLEGEKWAQHRRIVSPAFFLEKLKGMVPTIVTLASTVLEKWRVLSQDSSLCKEIDVCDEFKALTADIIAHTAFSSSYAEGKQVFLLQYEQQALFTKLASSPYIPGSRFLPTSTNRYRWSLRKQISSILKEIIQKRLSLASDRGSDVFGSDLLGLMLSALNEEARSNHKNVTMSLQEIIDECKTFFFAGHETTSSLLTWTIMLLAIHPEWQERAREEALALLGSAQPDADSLSHLKLVGMILHEALRLYPPAIGVFREADKDVKLGTVSIPGGTSFFIPILLLHVDPMLWGADALEFNPQRFEGGILKACKHPSAFLPFGTGPRICVGQNFAIMEAKTVLCMILQTFRFRLSPAYRHAPKVVLTLQPEHGMQILLEPLVV